jgi:VanZ family protein
MSRVMAIVGTMAVWGMLDEMHQDWIPGRQMDTGDLVADVTGAAVGAVLGETIARRREEESPAIS